MSWIVEHKRLWGIAILALLLLAILGPWAYDQINVPAEYPCSAPFIRLEGDFCGVPYSGTADAIEPCRGAHLRGCGDGYR